MSNDSPAVIIPPHHQSKAKEHPADRAIRQAQEEIVGGRYIPDPDQQHDPEKDDALASMGIALGAGTGEGVAFGQKPMLEDFIRTQELDELGRHPRVVEALEKMKHEIEEPRDPHEALERTFRLRELTAASMQGQRWDGQGRWAGPVNEEARIGRILTPNDFHAELCKVIGDDRVLLSPAVVRPHPGARSGRIGLYISNPAWRGDEKMYVESKMHQARELRAKGEHERKRAQRFRKLGMDSDAEKSLKLAWELGAAAGELYVQMEHEDTLRPPELLRVGTIQWPASTEWMIMQFNEWGVVSIAKFLGWRTALLTMIRCAAITEEEAHLAFPLGECDTADWYLEQLYLMRNPKGTIQ